MGNVLNTLSSATKEDAKLYNCIKELYDQGVPFEELKALIPDMKRTREQLRIKRMLENNIKPEYECFELGHIDTILGMAKKGEVPAHPMQFNFVLGVHGCTPATVENLAFFASKIPAGSTWTVSGVGRSAWTMAAAAIAMGGNVRVGFEDNIYLGKGQKAASNGELVAKVVRIAKELGREIATPAEAREILSLKPLK